MIWLLAVVDGFVAVYLLVHAVRRQKLALAVVGLMLLTLAFWLGSLASGDETPTVRPESGTLA